MIRNDIRLALRTARKAPGFTAAAVISIALGIAANTTVFSMVNATLLGALPVRNPNGLVALNSGKTFPYPDYRDFRDQCGSVFDGLAGDFPLAPASLATGSAEPERIWGALVTGNYFGVVGPPVALGRGIGPEDDQIAGRDAVVVVSDSLWRRRFGAAPDAVGKTAVLNGHRYTIVGVMGREFHGSERGIISEFWAPLAMRADFVPEMVKDGESRTVYWIEIVGRLRPGVTPSQAATAVNVVDLRIRQANHQERRKEPMTVVQAGGFPGEGTAVTGIMALLMGVVGLVLLIACANVANLLLARAVDRRREIGIRLALGADRKRLMAQLLTESVVLAAMGAVAGFALAFAAARALSGFQLPLPIPFSLDFTPDLRVLGFTAALTVATGLIFGLAPAILATRCNLVSAIKGAQGLGAFRRFGLRNLLVGVQVALSTVLLIAAGLFVRSLGKAAAMDLGIRPERVLVMAVDPKTAGYSTERMRDFLRQLEARVNALPGAQSTAAVNILPLSLAQNGETFRDATADQGKSANADVFAVTADFFRTIGIPVVRGRAFRGDTDLDRPLALVNRTMARRLFGDQDPIGRVIRTNDKRYEIVGVTGDSKSVTLGEEVKACAYIYLPREASEQVLGLLGLTILVKTAGEPRALEHSVRAEIAKLDPTLAVFSVDTMAAHVSKAFLIPRVCATLFGVFGAVGLALAAVGLFGVVSYSARSRTREIGIRMAIGAQPTRIVALIAGQGLGIAAISVTIGLAASFGLSRFTASLLYGISATDAVTFIVTPAMLLLAAAAAVLGPTRRACAVRPSEALRAE
jgi:predicted permease